MKRGASVCSYPRTIAAIALEQVKAAAPDLRDALIEALALLEYMATDRESAANHKTLVRARAAIAKARGTVEHEKRGAAPRTGRSDVDKAHERLSNLLEDEEAENDDIRDAAIELCTCLAARADK